MQRQPCRRASLITVTLAILLSVATLEVRAEPRTADTENTQGIGLSDKRLAFDVAENGRRFVFDEAPLDANGFPLYGNPFLTQGYIYPAGTLTDKDGDGVFNGVIVEQDPNDSTKVTVKPEFPDKVLGLWICEGKVFAQEGFNITSGPTVVTTQIYDFNAVSGDFGKTSLVSVGLELIDVGKGIARAIVGGTGRFRNARGQIAQTFLGVNASEGFTLRFEVEVP